MRSGLAGKRVFLVEDDTDLYELVRYNLEKEGFEISGSRTGEGVPDLCERAQPDIILLDVMLPAADGFEICRQLKARPRLAQVPIIFLTARGAEVDRVLGLELGAADYMVKPFSIRELIVRMKRHVGACNGGQTDPAGNGALRVGPLELDRARHRVTLGAQNVELTATEFRLLEFLMGRPGLVLSRAQILEAVWGSGDTLTERVIDVYVLRLRHKIELEDSSYRFIRSVRGYGYSFEDPTRQVGAAVAAGQ